MDVFALSMRLKEEGAAAVKAAVDQLKKSFDGASAGASNLDKKSSDLGSSLKKLLGAAVIGATIKKFAAETANAQHQQAQLRAALMSTGTASGQTIESLNAHAAALQKVTTFGDDAVNSAQKLLLTFTKIGGETFPKATEAVLNMATRMEGDLKGAAIQLGKALNDPVLGTAALSKAGIQFSESQKTMIKGLVETNQLAKAQDIILKELDTQFENSARMARRTFGGALSGLANEFSDLFELTDEGANSITLLINKFSDFLAENKKVIQEIIATWLPRLAGAIAGVGIAWVAYTAAVKGAALWTAAIALSTGQWWAVAGVAAAAIGGAALTTKTLGNAAKEAAEEFKKLIGEGGAMGSGNQGNIELTTTKIVDQVAALMKLVELVPVTRVEAGLLAREERTLQAALSASNLTYAKRLELTERLLAVQKARQSARVRLTADELMAAEFTAPIAAITTTPFRIRRGFLGGAASVPSLDPSKKALERDAANIKKRTAEAIDQARVELFTQLEDAREQFGNAIGNTLVESFAAGIERAIATGSIGEGFKALGQTLLSGLGTALQMFGTQAIIAGKLMKQFMAAMGRMDPITGIAAGIAMVAIGSALKGTAAAAFGGQRGASSAMPSAGGFMSGGGRMPTMLFGPTMATAAAGSVSPAVPMSVTIIGPNDPSAQRAMQELINKANRRGNV
jgi:hypothetical protein